MKFYLGIIPIILVIGGSTVQGQIPVGRSINYQAGTQRTSDGLPIIQGSYSDSRRASESTRRNTATHDDNGLSLYEDFVNDPWKPTEDLGSLLSQRVGGQQNQLRSGGSYDSRDDIWARRQPISQNRHYPTASPVVQQGPFNPIYGNDGNAYWAVSTRDDNHITYVRRDQYSPNPIQSPTEVSGTRTVESKWRSGAAGSRSGIADSTTRSRNWESRSPLSQDDDTWIVESRSDGHITYRKRISPQTRGPAGVHGWKTSEGNTGVQTLGHGDGQVLARVVNTATDDAFATVHSGYNTGRQFGSGSGRRSGLASYKSMRSSYAHDGDDDLSSGRSRLQLKSGDYVSYRGKDGHEAVYSRYRQPSTTTSTTTPSPPQVHYEQEGDWKVVSKDDAHITWSRVGAGREIDNSAVPPVQHRTSRYYGTGPHYPMMRERAFREHDSRLGSSNVLAV